MTKINQQLHNDPKVFDKETHFSENYGHGISDKSTVFIIVFLFLSIRHSMKNLHQFSWKLMFEIDVKNLYFANLLTNFHCEGKKKLKKILTICVIVLFCFFNLTWLIVGSILSWGDVNGKDYRNSRGLQILYELTIA